MYQKFHFYVNLIDEMRPDGQRCSLGVVKLTDGRVGPKTGEKRNILHFLESLCSGIGSWVSSQNSGLDERPGETLWPNPKIPIKLNFFPNNANQLQIWSGILSAASKNGFFCVFFVLYCFWGWSAKSPCLVASKSLPIYSLAACRFFEYTSVRWTCVCMKCAHLERYAVYLSTPEDLPEPLIN